MENYDVYQELANAIILQAVKDFRKDAKIVKQDGLYKEAALRDMKYIVSFIKSDWFGCLTEIEPDMLLKKLKEEIGR
jgi:hypothetical protein